MKTGLPSLLKPAVIQKIDDIAGVCRVRLFEPLEEYKYLALQSGRHRIFRNELVLTSTTMDIHHSQIE